MQAMHTRVHGSLSKQHDEPNTIPPYAAQVLDVDAIINSSPLRIIFESAAVINAV